MNENNTETAEGKEIKLITVKYEDGTEKQIHKGLVLEMETVGEEIEFHFQMVDSNFEEFGYMMYGLSKLLKMEGNKDD